MSALDAVAGAIVEGIVNAAIDRIRKELDPDDHEVAMLVAADRLRLLAYAQSRLDERKKKETP